MKKLVSWYKKRVRDWKPISHPVCYQINFVTNALILLAFTSILLLVVDLCNKRIHSFNLVSCFIVSFTMGLPYGVLQPSLSPIFLLSFIGSVGGLASSTKKLRKKLSNRICLKIGCRRKEKGQREDDASLMKEKQESPNPKPVKRKSNSLQLFFWFGLFAFSKRFSFTSSRR